MQQLELFPEDIRIERVDPETNMYRYYRLRLMPDLFGGMSLLREWGRIGTQGRQRCGDPLFVGIGIGGIECGVLWIVFRDGIAPSH